MRRVAQGLRMAFHSLVWFITLHMALLRMFLPLRFHSPRTRSACPTWTQSRCSLCKAVGGTSKASCNTPCRMTRFPYYHGRATAMRTSAMYQTNTHSVWCHTSAE